MSSHSVLSRTALSNRSVQTTMYEIFFFFNVYLYLRETEAERGRGSLKQASGSELSAQSLNGGSNSQDHDLSLSPTLNPLGHPGAHVWNFQCHSSSIF